MGRTNARSTLFIASTIAVLGISDAALANDSSAELATGGLVFIKNPDVEMQSEDLFISADAVRIRYSFFNNAARDVTSLVAFPMPDIKRWAQDENVSVPSDNANNPLDFSVTADGEPVATDIEQKAIVKHKDQAALLKNLGIPLDPNGAPTSGALEKLPMKNRSELISLGLVEESEYDDDGSGMKKHLDPRWTLRTTYHWQQTFPAGKEIVIEQKYKPSVGGFAGTVVAGAGSTKENVKHYRQLYCLDDDIIRTVQRSTKRSSGGSASYSEKYISYILKTGANWAGPIKDFHLVIDKGDAANLVSFCADGAKKISPTQFEVRKSEFTPTNDLDILILEHYNVQ